MELQCIWCSWQIFWLILVRSIRTGPGLPLGFGTINMPEHHYIDFLTIEITSNCSILCISRSALTFGRSGSAILLGVVRTNGVAPWFILIDGVAVFQLPKLQENFLNIATSFLAKSGSTRGSNHKASIVGWLMQLWGCGACLLHWHPGRPLCCSSSGFHWTWHINRGLVRLHMSIVVRA